MSTAQLTRSVPRAAGAGRRQAARAGVNVARYLAVTLVALLFLLPFYIMVKTAVSPAADVASRTFVLWPSDPDWSSFSRVLQDPTFPRAMLNTAVMAVVLTGGQIVLAAMAGYAMARIPNRAAKPLFSATIVVLLIPAATTFLPNFLIVARLGWVDSLRGLIIPGLFSAFNVFLFRQFFLNFPKELEEAGRLDGLGYFGVFRRIVVPNTLAFASALTVLGFVGSWNAFLWPLVVAGGGSGAVTVQVYLSSFLTAQTFDYSGLFAAALLSLLPVLFVFLVLQRWLVRGVAETGMGGG
ncbi:carbohydrate ABC transporter permease [Kineococcus sp. NPDC059986]|jgi:multiple sugar transport system permease protein|uniref:carbohydrate ABC transporter permease n=1 Tax=Kineococcus sp. NPDC059986 TaxID=3155538 RepID=UPI00344E6616